MTLAEAARRYRFEAAEKVCRTVEQQLAAWDLEYPDRKDDGPDNREIRKALAKWQALVPQEGSRP